MDPGVGGGAVTRAAKFDVFLSYNRAEDGAAAERLRDALRARGLTVFFDRDHIAPGARWQPILEAALATCGSVAICIGGRGLGRWQQNEKQLALERERRDGGFSVVPVLLPGADDPGLDFVSAFNWVDLRDGLDQAAEIDALASSIRGDAVMPPGRPNPRAEVCPYRGLRPFREEDAAFFKGREAASAQLADKVLGSPFTMVAGASGCGKSSVAMAGLLPRLRAGAGGWGWEIITLTPGAHPLDALMATLSPPPENLDRAERSARRKKNVGMLRDGTLTLADLVHDIVEEQAGIDRVLLLVDQFEELYTQCESEADRALFVDLLLDATARADGPLHVVVTLRGDFYGRALAHRALADRLDGAVVNVGPMTRDELRRATVEPAAQVGLSFPDGVAERILDDVGSEPGNLPLLEYLLTELWDRRAPDGTMTAAAYGAIGGVKGAIATRADEELRKLSAPEQDAARRVLVSLVTPGEGREDTRARAVVPAGDADAQSVIRRFADARLLTTDHDDALNADTVEVSHEALIREWATLKEWVDRDRELLRTLKRVRDTMAAWTAEQTDRDSRLLPPGRPLEEARELLARDDALIDDVRPFIARSIAAKDARRTAEQHRLDEENRRRLAEAEKLAAALRSKRKATMAGLVVAFALMLVAGAFAWRAVEQQRIAQIAAANAQRLESIGLANLARQQTKSGDAVTAMLLALEGLPKTFDPPERPVVAETVGALIEAMLEQRERVVLRGDYERITSIDLSSDGSKLLIATQKGVASESKDMSVRILDAQSGRELVRLLHEEEAHLRFKEYGIKATFSPDATQVLTQYNYSQPRLWDAEMGGRLRVLGQDGDTDPFYRSVYSCGNSGLCLHCKKCCPPI